jgi:hypothetical protein
MGRICLYADCLAEGPLVEQLFQRDLLPADDLGADVDNASQGEEKRREENLNKISVFISIRKDAHRTRGMHRGCSCRGIEPSIAGVPTGRSNHKEKFIPASKSGGTNYGRYEKLNKKRRLWNGWTGEAAVQ